MNLRTPELIQLFLDDERIEVNTIDESGFNLIFELYNFENEYDNPDQDQRLKCIETLFASPRIDLSHVEYGTGLPLHLVCWNQHRISFAIPRAEAFLKAALNKDVDINARDSGLLTAAHFAFGYFRNPK